MKKEVFYLDEKNNYTTLEKATWIVMRQETKDGELLNEVWMDNRTTRKV